ncbi:ATP-binding protein [Actinoplanes sp. NPDC051494]|uniref:ATP-binding protein n=1 Tax=Actinoplanes sp. NPDC051494 TaxID=3363907 RepID=UPI003789F267
MLKRLADQPEALLVDISAMIVQDPLALTVFPDVARQAARWPGISILLCAPAPATRRALEVAACRRLPVLPDLATARTQARTEHRTLPTISDDLLPVPGSVRQARTVVTDACHRWDLPALTGPATLIASEFVTNAVTHAATPMTLRLSLTRRYLHLSVRDGSPAAPAISRDVFPATTGGRGLLLVETMAHSWGWLPGNEGKVVWACLPRA